MNVKILKIFPQHYSIYLQKYQPLAYYLEHALYKPKKKIKTKAVGDLTGYIKDKPIK